MKTKVWTVSREILLTLLILILATVLGSLFRTLQFHETNIVVVYIFSVLLISRFTKGYVYGIAASVVSLLLFNWFFTEPYFTFKVNDMTYFITFAMMMLTSVLTSALTTKVKKAAEEAREREKESNALYQMTNHLTDAEDADAIAGVVAGAASEVLGCSVAFLCFDETGAPEKTFLQCMEDRRPVRRDLKNPQTLLHRIAHLHSGAVEGEQDYLYPIYGKSEILALLQVPTKTASQITPSQTRMLHSIIESAALALERLKSLKEEAKSREETTQERYRGNLLRAISHDIRTPLSGIMGTSEMIIGACEKDDPCAKLAADINRDARWLHDMVENILNLTKLRDGKLILEKQPEVVEEVIGATLTTLEKRMPDRSIEVELPENVVMAPMDARLISQVLINLLDNANKHTPMDKEVSLSVSATEQEVSITVADRGCGIQEKDLPHIFKMFYTTSSKGADSARGVGLGLAICQSIVEAHGGTIAAENREGGGAAFCFTLPLGGNS